MEKASVLVVQRAMLPILFGGRGVRLLCMRSAAYGAGGLSFVR